MNTKLGGWIAISSGIGMLTGIVTQNIPGGVGYGMAGGLVLIFVFKRILK